MNSRRKARVQAKRRKREIARRYNKSLDLPRDRLEPRSRSWLETVGRGFVLSGSLLILFGLYQLWFTDILQADSQHQLVKEMKTHVVHVQTLPTKFPRGPVVPLAKVEQPGYGQWLGLLQIPKIHLSQVLINGTDVNALRLGPGHYRSTPLPGEAGNVAIAGHRTTWGRPFRNLDQLSAGDLIYVATPRGLVVYRTVSEQVVLPTDVAVLNPTTTNVLTLTTCNPPYSATSRLVLRADLVAIIPPDRGLMHRHKLALPSTAAAIRSSGGGQGLTPVILYTVACALLVEIANRWRKDARRPWLVFAVTAPLLVYCLFGLFNGVAWLLPAGY